jgi:hypothetical protein
MAIRIAMDGDRLKRLQAPQMTQIRAPQASPMPSNEPSGMQQIGSYVAGKAAEQYGAPLVDKGLAKVAGMFTPAAAAAPTAAQFAGLKAAAPLATGATTGAGIAPGMAQAILGSGSAAAPLVAQTAGMTGAGLAGTTAAGLGTAAGTSAAAAGAGATPLLAALGPVGMAIGAGLMLKQFGLFSKGGHVGPLYSATGSSVDPLRKYPTSNTGFRTGNNSGSQFSDYTTTPPTSSPPVFDLVSEIPVVETPSGSPSGFVPYGSGQDPMNPGSSYTVYNHLITGLPPAQMTWDQMTQGQQTAQYYTSPEGTDAYGNFQTGNESDIAMNPAMWVQQDQRNYNKDEPDFSPVGGWDVYYGSQDSSSSGYKGGDQ